MPDPRVHENQAHVGGSIAVVPIHKAVVVAGSRRCTDLQSRFHRLGGNVPVLNRHETRGY